MVPHQTLQVSRCRFFRPKAGSNLRRDHLNRTKSDKSGAGPISAIPVVEVIWGVLPAAEFYYRRPIIRPLPDNAQAALDSKRYSAANNSWGYVQKSPLSALFSAQLKENRRFRAGLWPTTTPNQSQNIRHGIHKPAHNESERFWSDVGTFRGRPEHFQTVK